MKFSCSIEIELSREKVVELFDNPDNLNKWQDGFVSFEHLSGMPGQQGAKNKLVYKSRKHVIELTETILANNLPDDINCLYEHKHMVNTMRSSFTPTAPNKTKYKIEIGYTKFIGFMPKMMALLMPGVFKKQTQKWVNQFKAFAETPV